jgi:hypothetical protein
MDGMPRGSGVATKEGEGKEKLTDSIMSAVIDSILRLRRIAWSIFGIYFA